MSTLTFFYGRPSLILAVCIALRNALYANCNLLVTNFVYGTHVSVRGTRWRKMYNVDYRNISCYMIVHTFVLCFYTKDFLLR